MSETVLVGASTCLLGESVRWDGGQRRDPYLNDILARHVRIVPVCPETELGMGVPREPIHLDGDVDRPRLLGNTTGTDWTARMERWCRRKVAELAPMGLSGYVLKSRSPSCGMTRVPVLRDNGAPVRKAGRGLFAAELMRRLPLLPVEEEVRLNDPAIRENFIVRVFARHRLRALFTRRASRRAVVAYHARQGLLLRAHDPRRAAALDRLVSAAGDLAPAQLRDRYAHAYMDILRVRSTPRKNVAVLRRAARAVAVGLEDAAARDLFAVIDRYGSGLVPLLAPLALLNHHLAVHRPDGAPAEDFLMPSSAELALRNHV